VLGKDVGIVKHLGKENVFDQDYRTEDP